MYENDEYLFENPLETTCALMAGRVQEEPLPQPEIIVVDEPESKKGKKDKKKDKKKKDKKSKNK